MGFYYFYVEYHIVCERNLMRVEQYGTSALLLTWKYLWPMHMKY